MPSEEKALSDCLQLIEAGNQCFEAGDFSAALDIYLAALEKGSYSDVAHFKTGEAYLALGNPWIAAEHYMASVEQNPALGWGAFGLGKVQEQFDDLEKAARYFEDAISADPENYLFHQRLGEVHLFTGQVEKAIKHFETVLSLNSSFPWAHIRLAEAVQSRGELEIAEMHCRAALEIMPDMAAAKLRLESILSSTDSVKGAKEDLKKIEAQTDKSKQDGRELLPIASHRSEMRWQEAMALLRRDQIEEAFSLLIKLLTQETFLALAFEEEWLKKADSLRSEGRWLQAIPYYSRCLEDSPTFWPAYHLGDCLRHERRTEEALVAYAFAGKLNPDSYWTFYFIGQITLQLGCYEESAVALERATQIKNDHAYAWHLLGTAYSKLLQWAKAIDAIKYALKLDPKNQQAKRLLAEVSLAGILHLQNEVTDHLIELLEHDENVCLEELLRFSLASPSNIELHLRVGREFFERQRYSSAAAVYRFALTCRPDLLHFICQIEAEQYERLSREASGSLYHPGGIWGLTPKDHVSPVFLQESSRHLQEDWPQLAADLHEPIEDNRYLFAEAAFQLGNCLCRVYAHENAISFYYLAIELEPRRGWFHKMLGDCFSLIGRHEDALKKYLCAVELDQSCEAFARALSEQRTILRQWEKVCRFVEAPLDYDGRPRWLIFCAFNPCPPVTGGAIRVYEKIRFLCKRYRLCLVTFITEDDDYEIEKDLSLYCEMVVPVRCGKHDRPQSRDLPERVYESCNPEMNRIAAKLSETKWDIVTFDFIFMAPYLKYFSNSYTVLEEHNIESELLRQTESSEGSNSHEFRRLAAYEDRMWPQFKLRTVVSAHDQQLLERRQPGLPVIIVPNGTNTRDIKLLPAVHTHRLLFMGHLGYEPNIDAVIFLVKKIMPLVWEIRPDIVVCIAGRTPHDSVLELGRQQGVHLVPNPDDMSDVAATCSISVVPLRMGSGTRLKILDSMAMGLPVISTSLGAQGLNLDHIHEIILADEPVTFAKAITNLMDNPNQRLSMRERSRRRVEEEYDWHSIFSRYEQQILNHLDASSSTALTLNSQPRIL